MTNEMVLTVVGNVVSTPTERVAAGRTVVQFRLASTQSRPDGQGGFVDKPSTFFTVTCWDVRLGRNIQASFRKGERVIVHGHLDASPFVNQQGENRVNPEIRVLACGHALTFGTTQFRRVRREANGDVTEAQTQTGPNSLVTSSPDSDSPVTVPADPHGSAGPGPDQGHDPENPYEPLPVAEEAELVDA